MPGWIGVDLDGTLAEYNGWVNAEHIGKPIIPMVKRVRQWIEDGVEVRIFTARVSDERGWKDGREATVAPDHSRQLIEEWCRVHLGFILPVTCTKDFGMIELWDDRCIHVPKNTGIPCCDHMQDPP